MLKGIAMNWHTPLCIVAVLALANLTSNSARAEPPVAASNGQQVLASAAASHKYTFVVFYKDNNPATQAMTDTVKSGVESHSDRAVATYVNVGDTAEKPLVARFGVDRAPMPMAVAVAPNGAVTGVYSKTITKERFASAFVTTAMTHCMKAMQDGKMVFICVSTTGVMTTPAGVASFRSDPQFQNRTAVVHIPAGNREEAQFLKELQLGPHATDGATIAFLAPPGALVGTFSATATKDEMAAALHAAGKCCDDPNCKHNKK
jgi:hypothetical protein